MNTAITRRTVLAGALSLPWLAACSPASAPAGVDCTEGTFSCRFWPGHQVRGRLARPATRSSAGARAPLAVALHGHGGDANWGFDCAPIERHVAATGLAVATVDGGDVYRHARKSGIDTGTWSSRICCPCWPPRHWPPSASA